MTWPDKLALARRRLEEADHALFYATQVGKWIAQELDDFEQLLELAEDYRELHSCAAKKDPYFFHTGCSKCCDELDQLLAKYGRGRAAKKEEK